MATGGVLTFYNIFTTAGRSSLSDSGRLSDSHGRCGGTGDNIGRSRPDGPQHPLLGGRGAVLTPLGPSYARLKDFS